MYVQAIISSVKHLRNPGSMADAVQVLCDRKMSSGRYQNFLSTFHLQRLIV